MPACAPPPHGFHDMRCASRPWQAIETIAECLPMSGARSCPALLLAGYFGCVTIACLFLLRRGLLLNVSDDKAGIHITHVDVGHPHVVFFQERRCNRVLFFQQLVGVPNDLCQPLPAADADYAQQIWPDLVSMSDGMARDTIPSEQILTLIEVFKRTSVSRTRLLGRIIVREIIEKIANHPGLESGVVQGGTAYPLADCIIADQEMGNMAVCVNGRVGIESQPPGQKNNVLFFACQKGPARSHMKLFHVAPQYFGGVVLRINADGIKEDIFAYPVTELLLHLRQAQKKLGDR